MIDSNSFKQVNTTTNTTATVTNYVAHIGRDGVKFQYVHTVDGNTRLDPSSSNIMDMYILTRTYDINFRLWLAGATATKPLLPSSDSLYTNFNTPLAKIKSISDTIVYHPVKYKILFGSQSDTGLQATFKIVKNSSQVTNDSDIKSRVITAINQFFALENWEFGDTFYFSELSTYVMNELAPDIATFVIVPKEGSKAFGSLFEIKSENDEIFISGAKVSDVEIIDAVTASKLKADGNIATSSSTVSTLSGTLPTSSGGSSGGSGY